MEVPIELPDEAIEKIMAGMRQWTPGLCRVTAISTGNMPYTDQLLILLQPREQNTAKANPSILFS